jgi:hypothetical protein
MAKSILERWNITEEELTEIVDKNPSLRGMMLGYVAEVQLRKLIASNRHITSIIKPDNHDRSKKGDFIISYQGQQFIIELKSLQTNSIKIQANGTSIGKIQCDASDRREITLPNGHVVNTTLLQIGEFDILAANLFAFTEKWEFAFALNRDLPTSTSSRYTVEDQKFLIKSLIPVTQPIEPPFVTDLSALLDRLVQEKRH